MDRDSAKLALESTLQRVAGLDVWSTESLEGEIRPLAEELNVKTGQLFGAIRVAVTGRKAAPRCSRRWLFWDGTGVSPGWRGPHPVSANE